jgi:hypothetical protein
MPGAIRLRGDGSRNRFEKYLNNVPPHYREKRRLGGLGETQLKSEPVFVKCDRGRNVAHQEER